MRAPVPGAVLAVVLVGCADNTPTYFPSDQALEVGAAGGMASASTVVAPPFRAPTAEETQALAAERQRLGFAVPWLRRDRVAVSVLWTATNLGDRPGTAQILIDGASEFAAYDAQAIRAALQARVVNDDDVVVLSLYQGTPFVVQPGRSVSGVVREDELGEAALDLDAIGRWRAPPEAVLINASEVQPIGLEQVPGNVVVPALHELTISFTATTHMRLELVVRVRDQDARLARAADTPFAPMPMRYMPMTMTTPTMMAPASN